MQHYFLVKKNAAVTKKWLAEYCPGSVPGNATIRKWFDKFRIDHKSAEGDEPGGRVKEAVICESINNKSKKLSSMNVK